MGEHVSHNGESVKIGTCEELFYLRFDQAEGFLRQCERQPGNLPPMEYLNPAHGWKYRFPFPDEDNTDPGCFQDYNKSLCVSVDPDFMNGVEHDTLQHECNTKQGGYRVNVSIPCPATLAGNDDPATPKHSQLPDRFPMEIIQQKQMTNGQLWLVCRCGWCGVTFRLSADEGMRIVEIIKEGYPDLNNAHHLYWRKVAQRIEAGYLRVATPCQDR